MTPEQRTERARLAALSRHRRADPAVDDEQRRFRADRLEQHVREVVDRAPPLTQAQRERIAAALRAPNAGRDGDSVA